MALMIEAEPVPLEAGEDGVVRVFQSDVTLDVVVADYHKGAAAEEIARRHPPLRLADVHAVIAYYLRHRTDVDSYLRDEARAGIEERRVASRADDASHTAVQDVVLRIPPRCERTVRLTVERHEKAAPRIVEPEGTDGWAVPLV